MLWESRARLFIEALCCCTRTEAAEERRRWREQRATQAAANGSGGPDPATASEPAGGQAASPVATQKSAQLAVANFDAEGLSAELEGVVQQAALSSAGNAVGEHHQLEHLIEDDTDRLGDSMSWSSPACQSCP